MWAIQLVFTSGRFHATPWDHHANEGVVEWPPSPLRLVRALVSAAYRAFPDGVAEPVQGLLCELADALPSYRLPPSTEAHVRHYMPIDSATGGDRKSTRVLDAFRALGDGAGRPNAAVEVAWPSVQLGDRGPVLDRLLAQLGYLGRAESRVAASRVDLADESVFTASPGSDGPGESVPLLCADSPDAITRWHKALDKKSRKSAPTSVWDVLTCDIAQIQKAKWSRPPGTRWVSYRVQSPAASPRALDRPQVAGPTVLLYTLWSRVRPPVRHTLRIAERMRTSLLSWSDGAPEIAGKDDAGRPMRGHRHARVMPVDSDGDGLLDQILVTFTDGISQDLARRLAGPPDGARLWGQGHHDLELALVGRWTPDQVRAFSAAQRPAILGTSAAWRSLTPFVLPRHPKRRATGRPRPDAEGLWVDGPEAQLRRELDRCGFPPPEHIDWVEAARVSGRREPWYRFDRERRSGGGARGSRAGYGFVLRFAEPVSGPMALGYGSHFGLGVFSPE